VEELPVPEPGPGEALVAVRYGGVCGSDLHYWRHGGVGDFRLREPMVLGHEVVGTVVSYGTGATGPAPGTAVAVHPATPCGHCPECSEGRANVCRDTRYLGSAARFPHVQGAFAERIAVPAGQLRALPDGLGPRRAALAEPLSVALHAVRRAGDVSGRHVLVTGAGPIGCLVVAAAKAAGAARVTVTDLVPEALGHAAGAGADTLVRADDPAPNLKSGLPGDRRVLLSAAYRTSYRKVNAANGVPPKYRGYCARVAHYLKEYAPPGKK
jgi:L-idonate 5-dehydrogenase